MPTTFRPCAPDQSLLFSPSPRDWLPEGHLAFFIADTVAARVLLDEHFLDQRAVLHEDLDAIVDAIADVHQPVMRQFGAVHRVPELLRWRGGRVVRPERIIRLVPVRAPVTYPRA